jgi:DNA-binding CsgD family transcriptional regulator
MNTQAQGQEKKNGNTYITSLLHDTARQRASSLRWDTNMILVFYTLLVIVALTELKGANIYLVTGIALLGLLLLLIVSRVRLKKVEKKLYEEELDNYNKIIILGRQTSIAVEQEPTFKPPLSNRELEVLEWIAKGMINKQIAVTLGISSQTVKNHVSNILTKLEVNDRTSAVLQAVSNGWISIPTTGIILAERSANTSRSE